MTVERCVQQDVSFPQCESSDVGKISLQLNCNNDCIHVLRSIVEVMTARAAMNELQRNRVCVAASELFANISTHAYGGRAGKLEIESFIAARDNIADAGERGRVLIVNFRDYAALGWMGNIEEAAARLPDVEHLSPGGLGLKLICSIADYCEHQVLSDGNCWSLIFHIDDDGENDGCTA